jgi:hypothetical protein
MSRRRDIFLPDTRRRLRSRLVRNTSFSPSPRLAPVTIASLPVTMEVPRRHLQVSPPKISAHVMYERGAGMARSVQVFGMRGNIILLLALSKDHHAGLE